MARRGRPRKRKSITYDSHESKIFFGSVLFILSILSALTYLADTDSLILQFIQTIFGQVTIFSAIFLFNLSLNLFEVKNFLSNKKSLWGQFLFLTGTVIITTLFSPQETLYDMARNGEAGGIVGYYLTRFLERQVLAQFTVVFGFILVLVSLPMIFNLNTDQLLEKINKLLQSISTAFNNLFKKSPKIDTNNLQRPAETFGDFQKKLDSRTQIDRNDNSNNKKSQTKEVKIKMSGPSNTDKSSTNKALNVDELQYPDWKLPPTSLLNNPPPSTGPKEDIKGKSEVIEETLKSFGIDAKIVDVSIGPSVTQYALDIPLGTKVAKISNLKNDIALALAVASNAVRIEAPIPGTSFVGIEVPNTKRTAVYIKELIEDPEMKNPKKKLPVTVGKNIAGKNIITDIQKMPHLLIAGATGSGKSVLTNSFIISILMNRTPDQVRFIMVDPKQVELSDYNGIPHLLTPVITDMQKVNNALKWAIAEMERRYTLFRENQVRNIEGYNEKKGFSALPYIMIVIDEMADMMMTGGAEIEASIVRLAQKARATGLHLVLATQRPSVDVITGLIKANIPGRIGMSVTTQIDSRVILDQIGAESLLGMGDLLFKEPDKNKPYRLQGVLVTQEEVQKVVNFIKDQVDEVTYNEEITKQQADPNLPAGARQSAKFSNDELFADAVRIVVAAGKGSSSLIQRKLSIGYNRAARLLDELYKYGIVGPEKGSKPRDVLISDAEAFLNSSNENSEE